MSSRQLRKLQKQKDFQTEQDASDLSEDAPPVNAKQGIFRGFAALAVEDVEDGDDEELEPPNPTPRVDVVDAKHSSAMKGKSKKQKKKKKKKRNDEDKQEGEASQTGQGRDVIDIALIERLRQEAYDRICEVVRINKHHLKVVNEWRAVFGREAITAADEEEQHAPRRANMADGAHSLEDYLQAFPGKSLPELTRQRNPFLSGKKTWPAGSPEGLTLKLMKVDNDGTAEFSFVHDIGYAKLESDFFDAIQDLEPTRLIRLLREHPYHISTLIQVSKVAKQQDNRYLAGDLCERALFSFGRVSLSAFRRKLEQGKARLDFRRPENRQFWLAGYHYLKALIPKGTHRTALEWAKLLLSMDLSDPYGMIHFIHPLAIRAHQAGWFIDFCDSDILATCDETREYTRQTLVLAHLQQNDRDRAKAVLVDGMARLPWLYCAIYSALNLDVPDSIWGWTTDGYRELPVKLYMHQTKMLWENPQAISLLKEAAVWDLPAGISPNQHAAISGHNVARFIYLDNTRALMGLILPEFLDGPNWDFDPMPPKVEDNIFSHESQRQPWTPVGRPARFVQALTAEDLDVQNALIEMRRGGFDVITQLLALALESQAPDRVRQVLERMRDMGTLLWYRDEDPAHVVAEGNAESDERTAPEPVLRVIMDAVMARVMGGPSPEAQQRAGDTDITTPDTERIRHEEVTRRHDEEALSEEDEDDGSMPGEDVMTDVEDEDEIPDLVE